MRRLALLAVLLAVAAPPVAAQSTAARADARSTTQTRPSQTPLPALRAPGDDESLTARGLRRLPVVATPRLDRAFDDGSACRRACAPAYYDCRSEVDTRRCAPRWTQCLTACGKVPVPR